MEQDSRLIAGFYDAHAPELAAQYSALDPDDLYPGLRDRLPAAPARVLDAGAGTGRDAAWLRSLGHAVTAAEPSRGMREAARAAGAAEGVEWKDASLPALEGVETPEGGFAFVLAAAVWMHLDGTQRRAAWKRFASLTARGGQALVTLRHGPSDPRRPMNRLDAAEEIASALAAGFSAVSVSGGISGDRLGRGEVSWQALTATR